MNIETSGTAFDLALRCFILYIIFRNGCANRNTTEREIVKDCFHKSRFKDNNLENDESND